MVPGKGVSRKKRQDILEPQQPDGLARKTQEQAVQDILAFVNKYRSFAGSRAVLDNVSDVEHLEKFLREYKLLKGPLPPDLSFLQTLRIQIYHDLVEYLRSYNKVAEAVAVQSKLREAAPVDRLLQIDLAALFSESPAGYAAALSIYGRLLKENPSDFDALTGLAQLQLAQGDLSGALKNYELLLKAQPRDFSLKLDYARLLTRLNRYADARAYLNEIVGTFPDFYAAKVELARIATRLGDLAKADEQLDQVMNSSKVALDLKKEVYAVYREMMAKQDDLPRRRRYANLFSQDKRTFDWSIAEYQEIVKSGRADTSDRLALARVLSWNRQYDESINMYNEVLKSDPNATAVLAEQASVLRWTGRYSEALSVTDRLLALQPRSVEHKLEKARTLCETKDVEAGLLVYQELIQANPNQLPLRLEYAQTLKDSGKFEQAAKEYKQLLPLVTDRDVYLEYARSLAAAHRYADSDRVYQKILAEWPADQAPKLEFAQTLAWRNDLKAAQQYFSDGMQDALAARKTYAKLLFWEGKYEEARAESLSLLNLKPNDAELRFDAARALVHLEQFEEAINELEQLRAEHPNDKEIAAECESAVALKKAKALRVEKPETSDSKAQPETMAPAFKPGSQKPAKATSPVVIEPIKTDAAPSPEDLRALKKNEALLKQSPEDDRLPLAVADQLRAAKRHGEAVKMYRGFLADDPNDLDARLGLAETFLDMDDYTAAYPIFKQVLAEKPTNVRARYGLSQIYAYGGKIQDTHSALKELRQVLHASFTNIPAWESYAELRHDLAPSLSPLWQSHSDSDGFLRFSNGADYQYPINSRTTLISNYRYHAVRQSLRPSFDAGGYASWFGQYLTGRSYAFGIKQRLAANAQLQASVGGTNFNGGRSFLDASVSLDISMRRNQLFSISYEREPGLFFLNTIMALGAGLYGDRFQLVHSFDLHRKWEFTQSFQCTRLTSNHRYDAPDNTIKEARAAVRYKLTKGFRLGAGYAFMGFRTPSPLYYSPHASHAWAGDFSYEKSNKRIGIALSGSAGKLITDQTSGFIATVTSDLTLHLARNVQVDLSYQPLYGSAGSAFGPARYHDQTVMLGLRYWFDRPRYQ